MHLSERSVKLKDSLKPHKTVRDAVHGDIILNRLEIELMDTREFQRLRHIRQLGPSYLVYPCAHHTRFEHSLGTVQMAVEMIDAINRNPHPGRLVPADSYECLLSRTVALLHDLTHIPFGHTLEDEGGLLEPQWKDDGRAENFLGPRSTIGKILVDYMGEEFRLDARNTLRAETNEQIRALPYPFVADIVGNTICADLLDYLTRDAFFTGLKETYDKRFINYLYIPVTGPCKDRLVLRLWRKDRIRHDIASEVVNLLRLRHSLAEKIYYHHTKMAVSAMVTEAVAPIMDSDESRKLWTLGDDELLQFLENHKNPVASYLASKLRSRRIYLPVFTLYYSLDSADDVHAVSRRRLKQGCRARKGKLRFALERWLEDWGHLPAGSIVIYCPDPEMAVKEAKALIEWKDKIIPLSNLPDGDVEAMLVKERLDHIMQSHRLLWRFHIYMDREHLLDRSGHKTNKAREIERACSELLTYLESVELENVIQKPPENLLDKIIIPEFNEKFPELRITHSEVTELKKRITQVARRDGKQDWCSAPSDDLMKQQLGSIREGRN